MQKFICIKRVVESFSVIQQEIIFSFQLFLDFPTFNNIILFEYRFKFH